MTWSSHIRPWVVGSILLGILSLHAPPALAFRPACLDQLPAELALCFEQFLESGIADSDKWHEFLATIKNRIVYNKSLEVIHVLAAPPPSEVPLSDVPSENAERSEEDLVRRGQTPSEEVPYLSSGGWINVLSLKLVPGHSDVTREILNTFSFSFPAQLIAADASQDPDFYSWTDDSAHAQTPADHTSGRAIDPDQSVGAFIDWIAVRLERLKLECANRSYSTALYALGFSLHSVQDLAAHNGRTAIEHAWNSYCKNLACNDGPRQDKDGDPDEQTANIERARDFSRRLIETVKTYVTPLCWVEMKKYDGFGLTREEKLSLFNLRRDLTISEWRKYKAGRLTYASSSDKNALSVRWIPQHVPDFSAVLQRLTNLLRRSD